MHPAELMFTSNIKTKKKCYLCDFDRGVGAGWVGLGISETAGPRIYPQNNL